MRPTIRQAEAIVERIAFLEHAAPDLLDVRRPDNHVARTRDTLRLLYRSLDQAPQATR